METLKKLFDEEKNVRKQSTAKENIFWEKNPTI